MHYFYILRGVSALVTNVLTYCGVLRPTSLNGLRRRQPQDTDAAWTAGLRATLPWGLTLAGCLIATGCLLVVVPDALATPVVLASALVLVIVALLAVRRLDRTVKRAMASPPSPE